MESIIWLIMGFNQAIIGKDMENTGQILENIVYIELLRRGYEVKVGDMGNGKEVDFVCNTKQIERFIFRLLICCQVKKQLKGNSVP